MKCADDHGLMVTLRIGYCWDYSGEASLPERYAGVVQDGSNDRKMWIDYCKTIYDRVSDYGITRMMLLKPSALMRAKFAPMLSSSVPQ